MDDLVLMREIKWPAIDGMDVLVDGWMDRRTDGWTQTGPLHDGAEAAGGTWCRDAVSRVCWRYCGSLLLV